MLSTPK